MRLRISFIGREENITIPIHHNEILQGIIYKHLDTQLAERLHTKGVKDPESRRSLKLFTFSRFLAKKRVINSQEKAITFSFPIIWIVASPIPEFIVSFYNNLIKKRSIKLSFKNEYKEIYVNNIWLEPPPVYKRPVKVKTLSPITIYRTEKRNGKVFTNYYAPDDSEFNELILANLLRKYRALTGNSITLDERAYIKPIRVASQENILYFKNTVIKSWSGIFELSLPKELFLLAFSCGLGAKNSQGFGCIEIWRGNS
jgi:CRISPR-associated endoribonuclease Cas6